MLNADEVLTWCNGWRPREAGAATERNITRSPKTGEGGYTGAVCVGYDFEDLLLGAALMRWADVLVAVHGAAVMNAAFMRRGSSVVEVWGCDLSTRR